MAVIDMEQQALMNLLVAVAKSDRRAFQELYRATAARVYGVCCKLAGQQDLAEEALQETFVQIWHHAAEYHSDRGSPLSWILTIARYRTIDMVRSRSSRRSAGSNALDQLADHRAGPLDMSLSQAGAEQLNGCLEELSDVQRDSILLCYYRGLTHDELASALSSPIGTVKSWIRRGLKALKGCLER
ncbi:MULTISPECIES: sigma-70 family RNA polymerase sigma factor [Marinobacter]|uniref:sigma-70 family RNA polymerase sigma factor n=1 Tax=Marinobacter TaxID=2742 RepID=UPI001C958126|nr:sigma-70 family RNA polymerase sigma factor [Marinobacter nauticus]MBY5937191.1 sigma-70 family RNA polymerase sigma factor [Marinobacter nauticus]MBY5954566.1 sigma-70 family RNA polymerase sigma factor [Marinobacter nauticus]MBY5962674.1 sigma-70 family RNA polymerase sigma factor [Marinobacter nauticus]MBY6008212.1 sigma-70 family RNA polymerase sigma factor [Marinobacter nauticus]MBY6101889.1 sigma-70 family RNA polymerase sigma factor [Marinobacter nauticus]